MYRSKILSNFTIGLLFSISCLLILVEFLTHTNFVRELIFIDYVDFFALISLLVVVNFLIKPKKEKIKHLKQLLFLFPIFFSFSLLLLFMRYNSFYRFLEQEDSVIEWLQFFFIALSAIINFLLYKKWKKQDKATARLFLFLTFLFFIMAGEEISWGQRILGIETPAAYAELNSQGETNIHNYGAAFGLIGRAYILIGFFASTLWIFKTKIVKKLKGFFKKIAKLLIPGWHYALYFLIVFIHNLERFYFSTRTGDDLIEEPVELLLFFAVLIFLLEIYFTKSKQSDNAN